MKKVSLIIPILLLLGASCMESSVPDTNGNGNLNYNVNVLKPQSTQSMKKWNPPSVLPEAERTGKEAVIETDKGTIVFEILPDSPLAASNFITLAKGGYYDGLKFHRVVPGFVIQGGDPLGIGSGGPGYAFKDEPVKRAYDPGIVAMANSGPDTNGSQFFIMEPDSQPGSLENKYSIFGKVTSGLDVVGKIQAGDVMTKVTIQDKK
jgi:peptidylprolyl isomerase/peptidyl-prolyl cis-trans isomerase B (cyclophilin B)